MDRPDDVAVLAARWDALTADELRAAGSMKWSRYGSDVLAAWVAEMDFGTAPAVADALHNAVAGERFGYLPAPLVVEMADVCAAWQRDRYGWEVAAEQIFPLPDVLNGLEVAIEQFSAPDSAVILPVPAYMPFLGLPARLGRHLITVPLLVDDEGLYRFDLDGLDRAFAAGGNLLVLCNPCNPVGRVFDADELEAVAEVVDAHGGRVFNDEIHAPLVFEPHRHVPYASLSDVTAGHTITATSASKAWNLPGLKAAQLILTNEADMAHWRDVAPQASLASTLGVLAANTAYRSGSDWLAAVVDYLDGNRQLFAKLVTERLPGAVHMSPQGTYLAWVDCRPLGLGDNPGELFLDDAKVALVDGAACGAPGHVRVNLATPRPILTEIVDRLATTVAGAAG